MAGTLEFRLLGPLEVRDAGGAVRIKAAKQRALLASLLVDVNRVVPVDVLVARLWDETPPRGARNTLQNYVMRLRGAVVGTTGADLIETRPEGYLIEADKDAVDLHRFRSLVRSAELVSADEPERASVLIGEALGLWRGPPLLDVPSDVLHRELVPALTERRLAAVELGIAADLRLGRPRGLIGELRELTAAHPLREELWAQLMLALCQAGRQAEALECYQTVATLLAEELGVDPGPQLRAAQQAVLAGAPDLPQPDLPPSARRPAPDLPPPLASAPPPAQPSASALRPPPAQPSASALPPPPVSAPAQARPPAAAQQPTLTLPPASASPPANVSSAAGGIGRNDLPGDLPDLTDRVEDLQALLDVLPASAQEAPAALVAAIDGMAGVGKTTFAVHAAHRLTHRYPDLQLFLGLHGHSAGRRPTDPGSALEALLHALGVPDDQIPDSLDERAALWRAGLAGRRALLVLDDAFCTAQVRPLLPGGPGCLVLVTSRRRLTDLDTVHTRTLDVLSTAAARELFHRIAGADRSGCPSAAATDRGSAAAAAVDAAAVQEVVRLCGGLPLAIRLAAARLRDRPAWRVAHLASRLRDEQRRLGELAAGDRSVAAEFALSYEHLTDAQQRLFRLLGLVPGSSFDAHQAAALAASPVPVVERALEELVDMHLLQEPTPGRYHLQGLLYTHAAGNACRTESAAELQAARGRLLDFYLHTAAAARERCGPVTWPPLPEPAAGVRPLTFADGRQAAAWLRAEADNLRAAVTAAAAAGCESHALLLGEVLGRPAG